MSLATNVTDLAVRIATEFKSIRTIISGSGTGGLAGLTTTNKSSLVAAINEASTTGGSEVPPPAPDASETVKGLIELATLAEVTAGTDVVRAVTPAGVKQETNAAKNAILATSATEAAKGLIEIATLAEVATGTDSIRAVTPQGVKQATDAVKTAILGAGVPAALDTLDELAAALGDDANFAATVTSSLANKQPMDSDLTAIAALASAADKLPYATGAGVWALTTFTAAGRALVDDVTVADQRTTLSVYSQADIGSPTTDFSAAFVAALV